jgi:hypothetical protein
MSQVPSAADAPRDNTTSGPYGDRPVLRLFLLVCQGVVLAFTWKLWSARGSEGPVHLPLGDASWLDACQVSLCWPLAISLAVTWRWPRTGLATTAVLLGIGMVLDQWRVQPEMLSFLFLVFGTTQGRGSRRVAIAHLIALWLWGGLHKVMAGDYPLAMAGYLRDTVSSSISTDVGVGLAWGIAIGELTLALLAIIPRTRTYAGWLAAPGHLALAIWAFANSPVTTVGPWNLALALSALVYVAGAWRNEKAATPRVDAAQRDPLWSIVAAWLILIYPASYYANLCHPYTAWCLHSSNAPIAMWQPAPIIDESGLLRLPKSEPLLFRDMKKINVPLIAMPDICRDYLRRTGNAGDALEMVDLRPLSIYRGRKRILFTKEEDGNVKEEVVKEDSPSDDGGANEDGVRLSDE